MSELINIDDHQSGFRYQLLVTASVLALTGSFYSTEANAEEGSASKPTVWIELGGQLERIDSDHTVFTPSFVGDARPSSITPIMDSQRPPAYGFGGEAKIVFTPEASDWIFSAAIRYGRSNGTRHKHHQTLALTPSPAGMVFHTSRLFFGDGQTEFHESHDVVDFQVGRDVGLGLFGAGSSSVISAGVRFAQFNSSSNIALHARPYLHLSHNNKYPLYPQKYNKHVVDYTAVARATRSTHAIGPSVSWDASLPLIRRDEGATFELDWGLNASMLFGRQKAQVHHQTSRYQYDLTFFTSPAQKTARSAEAHNASRARRVTIPNVGGFAGVSLKFPNAKVAFGYRADFFFNAVDNGIDTRKSENLGFYGPFATISVGLGG